MSAYRCSICSVNWPLESDYEECPECGEPTDGFSNTTPIPAEEAARRKNYADFERYYEQREEQRKRAASAA